MADPVVTLCDAAAQVSLRDQEGRLTVVTIVKVNGEWRDVGSRQVYGLSPSDPRFSLIYGLSYKFEIPRRWIVMAERKLKRKKAL